MKSKKILVIDDEKEFGNIVTFNLRQKGFNTFLAIKGEEGLEIAKREKPDLIILDVIMHGMDGFEVCKLLKSGEETINIPVIFATVKAARKEIFQGLTSGAVAYLIKPFGLDELYEMVTQIIGGPDTIPA